MNKSIYVRVPNDIAHIIGLDNQVEVSFSFEDLGNELRLIYSLHKSRNQAQEPPRNPLVGTGPVIIAEPPSQTLRLDRRGENGTRVEAQGLTQE